MNYRMKLSLVSRLWFVLLLGPLALLAKEPPAAPSPQKLVNDYADLLTPAEEAMLEAKLVAFDDSTSNQIAIVTENSLDGDEVARYAHALAEKWGIGHAKERNGVLIYVSKNDRQVSIQVGYGLEAVIPDATAFQIIEREIKPAFRQEAYFNGLDNATTVLMKLASKEFSSSDYAGDDADKGMGILGVILVIFIVIVIIIISKKGGGGNNRRAWRSFTYGTGPYFGGGRGGFGGRSGGFGGFGGGSFGGGGASGGW